MLREQVPKPTAEVPKASPPITEAGSNVEHEGSSGDNVPPTKQFKQAEPTGLRKSMVPFDGESGVRHVSEMQNNWLIHIHACFSSLNDFGRHLMTLSVNSSWSQPSTLLHVLV